jgi:hypothetical protein
VHLNKKHFTTVYQVLTHRKVHKLSMVLQSVTIKHRAKRLRPRILPGVVIILNVIVKKDGVNGDSVNPIH